MATLLQRVTGIGLSYDEFLERSIPANMLVAHLVEWAEGSATQADIVAYYALDAQQETQLVWLKNQYLARAAGQARIYFIWRLEYLLILAEQGVPGYQDLAAIQTRIEAI